MIALRLWCGLTVGIALLAGPVITPSNGADLTLTNGLTLWLKADAGVVTNGSGVSAWNDQSGLGRNATQSTDASRPLLVTNVLDGKPVVRFDGVDDVLAVATTSLSNYITTTNFTTFAVFKAYSIKTDSGSPWLDAAVFIDTYYQAFGMPLRSTGPTFLGYLYGASATTLPITSGFSTNYFCIAAVWHETNWLNAAIYGGGSASGVAGDTTIRGSTSLRIGSGYTAGYELNVDIAEILIYKTALSDSNRAIVQAYLKNKWLPTTTGNLPVTNGLTFMLAADVGVLTEGSGVSMWNDQSGIMYHNAVQTSDAQRPLLVTNQLLGKPVVRFDGVDDVLSVAALPLSDYITATNFTTFAVFKANSIKTDSGSPWYDAAVFMDTANGVFGMPVRSNGPTFYGYNFPNSLPITSGFSTNAFVIASVRHNTNTLYAAIRKGGSASGASGDTSVSGSTGLRIGTGQIAGYELNVDIAEILIYKTALSDSERTSVETYLYRKWFVPLPSGTFITIH